VTVALDSSGLLARYLSGAAGDAARLAMAADPVWCACALALTEALMVVDHLDVEPAGREELRLAIRDDWERVHVVPVDGRCLDRAAELGRTQPLRTVDALHLAAADRLPRPLTYLTFDSRQIPVALSLGYEVVSV
jgi:predicted nucleic acid-binding protein